MQGLPSNRSPGAVSGWTDPDALCRKIVLVGNSGAGKTALVLRFVRDSWSDADYASTIGGSYLAKTVLVNDVPFTFQIWDTAGQERFRSMVRIYYRGASAAILCCDISDATSFEGLKLWLEELRSVLGDSVKVCIAATKADKEDRKVSMEELEAFAAGCGAKVTLTSARSKEGIDDLFMGLAKDLIASAPERNREKMSQFGLEPRAGDSAGLSGCGTC
mmetsp:Transcript_25211/g.60676  ORF Transcript_25211/g.60676 Transcript_25211/m.60676 type:complete len:218 (-) Transcript_25211:284-937(-)